MLQAWVVLACLISLGFGAVCLRIARGARARARVLERDLWEHRAQLERSLDELRTAHVRQEDFVARVSHELFTPLTTIRGTMSMLAEQDSVAVDEVPGVIALAAESSERMTRLVDDLMLASGLTRSVTYERVPFDVAEQVRTALAVFEPVRKHVHADLRLGAQALGDEVRFRVALSHLLSNADRFGPPDSTIRIDAGATNGLVSVTVSDEGPGIPSELGEAAFDRFTRFGAHDRSHEGLGLGLFIARQTARAMGGDVTIVEVPRGCAVRLSVPSAEQAKGSFGRKTAAAAIAATLLFFSGTSAAVAGRLPAPAQRALARVAELVGVELPTEPTSRAGSVPGLDQEGGPGKSGEAPRDSADDQPDPADEHARVEGSDGSGRPTNDEPTGSLGSARKSGRPIETVEGSPLDLGRVLRAPAATGDEPSERAPGPPEEASERAQDAVEKALPGGGK